MSNMVPEERIESKIFLIRGQKVMLDRDLAKLYGVKPRRLREQVKRNIKRFPPDFMFQLNNEEVKVMVSQNAIPSIKHLGGYLPYAFTEQGIAMLSSVLKSDRAISVNIAIVRAFVKLRQVLATHKEVSRKLKELEQKVEGHDKEIKAVFDAIRKLMEPDQKTKKTDRICG
ncbi:MAG: ORF6N domain-containing protein [Candidatus Margulisiibacteriota bacterium]|nr:ORF6N domain-containing protein [Candidatus Margulisiibacteriota bacterium]